MNHPAEAGLPPEWGGLPARPPVGVARDARRRQAGRGVKRRRERTTASISAATADRRAVRPRGDGLDDVGQVLGGRHVDQQVAGPQQPAVGAWEAHGQPPHRGRHVGDDLVGQHLHVGRWLVDRDDGPDVVVDGRRGGDPADPHEHVGQEPVDGLGAAHGHLGVGHRHGDPARWHPDAEHRWRREHRRRVLQQQSVPAVVLLGPQPAAGHVADAGSRRPSAVLGRRGGGDRSGLVGEPRRRGTGQRHQVLAVVRDGHGPGRVEWGVRRDVGWLGEGVATEEVVDVRVLVAHRVTTGPAGRRGSARPAPRAA